MEFLVRARAMSELGRLLNIDEDVEFMVTANTNHVLFRIGDVEIISSLISGAFPNYSQLIPTEHKTRAVISTDEFLRATRTASIFAREDSNIVRLQVGEKDEGPGHMTLSSYAGEIGDNTGEIEVRTSRAKMRRSPSTPDTSPTCSECCDGEIAVELSSPTTPGVLRPVEEDDFVHVVMPMFVQWT